MSDGQEVLTMIVVYQTQLGWRYRVGQRDDGNYMHGSDAFWAAENWIAHNPIDDVKAAS